MQKQIPARRSQLQILFEFLSFRVMTDDGADVALNERKHLQNPLIFYFWYIVVPNYTRSHTVEDKWSHERYATESCLSLPS